MKKILGLDLGTNSIGWAVINSLVDDEGKEKLTSISSCGSRIIPMDAATLGDFDKGNAKSSVAERTRLRGIRRLLERSLLRRERLHRVLSVMGFLPEHYASQLDRYGNSYRKQNPNWLGIKIIQVAIDFYFRILSMKCWRISACTIPSW